MREGWTYKKLGEVCEILNGFAFKSDKYVEQGIRVLRITNVQKGAIVDNDPKYYPYDEESNIKQYMLNENDLLMSLTGNVGRVGLLQKGLLPAALNQRVACLRLLSDIALLKYLFHLLNSDRFEKDSIFNAAGIAQKNMSTEWLKKYVIPVPPLSEQQRIVSELDLLSSIIEKKKAQLKEYDQLAQSIFYDMFGDPVTNEKGWKLKKMGEVCAQKSKIARASKKFTSNSPIEYIDISSVDNISKTITTTTSYIFSEAPSRAQQIVEYGDILISLVRPNLQNIAIVLYNKNNLVGSSGFCVIRTEQQTIKEYLFYVIRSSHFTDFLMQRVSGANYPAVREEDVKSFTLPIPPLSLQQQFASKIEAIEKQKELIKQSITETETLFNSRMDYYFN